MTAGEAEQAGNKPVAHHRAGRVVRNPPAAPEWAARAAGCRILHAPIRFHSSFADSPNKQQGVLKGIAAGGLFVDEEWGAAFHESMTPKEGDELVVGKKGLDSFPNTNLSSLLEGVKTLVIAGFLTSCCVESTMRSAYGECLLCT